MIAAAVPPIGMASPMGAILRALVYRVVPAFLEPMTEELAKKQTSILQQQQPSSSAEEEVSLDDIWKQMDDIREEQDDDSSSDDEDFSTTRKRRPVMVRLPCGDIHICGGCVLCPFLMPNEDKMLVCQYSGVEYEPEQSDEYFDLNGGSGKRSGDPDRTCASPSWPMADGGARGRCRAIRSPA
eukprot:5653314-Prymnesium_polylepis.2